MESGGWFRGRVSIVLIGCCMLASACGAIGSNDSDGSTSQRDEPNTESDSEGGGSDTDSEAEADGSESQGQTAASGALWTRHDPVDFLPSGPKTEFRGALPAGDGGSWTVVGSIFDFETNQATAATWETTDPASGSWARTDVTPSGEDDETMIGLARVGGLEVAVGSRGEIGRLQPAVWSRTPGGPWVGFNSQQLSSEDSEYITSVAVHEDGQSVMAIGVLESTDGIAVPTLWLGNDGRTWARADGARFLQDGSQAVFGIAAGADRWVMAGRQNLDDGSVVPSIWHSVDGTSWEIVDLPLAGDDRLGSANDVVWTGTRFVAVGEGSSDLAAEPRSWVSDDGVTWSEASTDFAINLEGRVTSDGFGVGVVEASNGRLVATANLGFVQQIWQSTNGLSWQQVDNVWDLRTTGVGAVAVAVTDDDILLATEDQSLLHHRDTWQVSPVLNSVAPNPSEVPLVSEVVAVDEGFVAVGAVQRSEPTDGTWQEGRTWFSPDGSSWTTVSGMEQTSLGPVTAVANAGGQAVAVGAQSLRDAGIKNEPPRSMLWEGSGREWQVRSDPALVPPESTRIHLQAAAVLGTETILGGWIFPGTASAADAYLLSSSGGAAFQTVTTGYDAEAADETIVALCSNDVDTAVAFIRVSDGDSRQVPFVRNPSGGWSDGRAADGSFNDVPLVEVLDCDYGGDRFIAAGWISDDRVGTDIRIWESRDGSAWNAVAGPPEFATSSDQWVSSVTAIEGGYLVAGVDTSTGLAEAVVWYGDGDGWFPIGLGDDAVGMDFPAIAVGDGVVTVVGTVDGAPRAFTASLANLVSEATG